MFCKYHKSTTNHIAFFIEDRQFAHFKSVCRGSAIKLKGLHPNPSLAAIVTDANSFLHKVFVQIMDKLIPAGIPQHLYNYHESMMFKPYEPDNSKKPKVLSIDDLFFGFILWICACGISSFAFFMEILCNKLSLLFRNCLSVLIILLFLRDHDS